MPTQTPKQGKPFASTPRKRFRGVFVVLWGLVVAEALKAVANLGGHTRLASVFSYTRGGAGVCVRAGARARRIAGAVVFAAVLLSAIGANLAHPAKTAAATADTVNFQAKLMTNTGSIAPDGNYNVEFNLYNVSTGGTSLWTEDYLNSASQGVRVANGYLTVNLGSHTAFPSINWDQDLYVTMNIGGTGGSASWDGEMSPRLKLTAVPYAFAAGTLAQVNPSGGFKSTLSFQGATGGDQSFQLPDLGVAASDTICLVSLGNCAGSGSGITGSGVQNYISKFDTVGGNHIGVSSIFDNGTIVGINASSGNGRLTVQGGSATQNGIFVQGASSATAATLAIQQSSSQTGPLVELSDSAGNVNASFNATGEILTLGRVASSGTVSQGKLILSDGTTDNFSVTLQSDTLTNNTVVSIPATSSTDTVCLLTLGNCVGSGGGITGSGTQNYLTKFNNAAGSTIGNASLYDNGSFVGLNTTTNNGLLSVVGSSSSQTSFFVQGAASASVPTALLQQGTSQTADLLQLQDVSGNVNGAFSSTGAQLTLGRIAATGTVTQGKILLADGTTDSFGLTLQTGTLSTNRTISLPDASGTVALTNDTANFVRNQTAQQASANFNIDGTGIAGILQAGTIDTATGATLNLGTTNATSISLNQNTVVSGTKTFTVSGGLTSLGAGVIVTGSSDFNNSIATKKGADFSTTGTSNNVNFGNVSLIRLTGTSAQTITGIANGRDGYQLTIVNAGSTNATLANNSASSSAANRITTGTGGDTTLPPDASITLVYDSGAGLWRINGGTAGTGGVGAVGPISSTSNANGATITGNTINLTAADGTNGGVLTAGTQTIGGAKTFAALITGNAGLNVSGGAVSLQGNAASSITTTSGDLTLDAAAGLNLGNTTATGVTIGRSGITTTIQGNTAVTLSGTTGATLVCQNGSGLLAGCTNTYETTTGTDFIRNQSASAQSGNFFIQGASDSITAVVQGASGATNPDIIDFKTSGGTTVANVDYQGNINTSGTVTASAIAATLGQILTTSASSFSSLSVGSTATNTSASTQFVAGINIGLAGTNNPSGLNLLSGISFANVTPATNNAFTGLFFGTGYDSLLNYNGSSLVSGSGLFQNAGFDSTLNYSNLQKVTNLTATGNVDIQGTTKVVLSGTTGTTLVCQNGSSLLSTCDASYLAPTSTNFIQNQNSTTQVGTFKIDGTGTAASFQIDTTGSFDTSAAGALNIGTTNATSINLNQNVNIAASKNITFATGAGNFDQSASTGTFATGTGAISLNGDTTVATGKNLTVTAGSSSFTGVVAGASTAVTITSGATSNVGLLVQGVASQTADLVQVKANGVSSPLLSVGSTGATTLRNSADGTTALQIQNAAGNNIMTVSTSTGATVSLGHAGSGIVGYIGTALTGTYSGASSATVQSYNLSKNVPAGHTLVGTVTSAAATGTMSVTDSKGNSYTVDAQQAVTSTMVVFTFHGTITTPLTTSDTLTFTDTNSSTRWAADVEEFDNILTVSPVDQTTNNTGNSTSPSTGTTSTTTAANEVVFAGFGYTTTAPKTFTPGSGYSGSAQVTTSTGSSDRAVSNTWKTVTATGTQNETGTLSGVSVYGATIVTYKANAPDAGAAASISFNDGTSSGFTSTIKFSGGLTGNRNVYLPDASGTLCLDSGNCSAAGGYIVNGTGLQTGNFNISGTGVASIFQAATFDTATATTLNLGTTNATSINLAQNTVVAAGKSITLTGGNTASRPSSPTEGMIYYDTDTKQLLVYSNGKWQSDRSSNTKIVAASNASQAEKDGADYVASGTADQTVINSALTAAAGGRVYLTEGTFSLTDSVNIPNNTTLAGSGRGTLLQLANLVGQSKNAITNSDTTTGTGVTVRDLRVDGNRSVNTSGTMYGILFDHMGGNTGAPQRVGGLITNVWADEFITYGIYVNNSANTTVTSSEASHNNSSGIRANNSNEITITNNNSQTNGGTGFVLNVTTNSILSGNNATANLSSGINVSFGSNNTIIGNNLYDNGSTSANDSIKLASAVNTLITGNSIADTAGTGYAINISDSASTGTYLANNYYNGTGATAINDAGTGTIFGGQLSGTNYVIQPAGGISLNGNTTITGNITQSGGTFSLTGNAASQISTSAGNLTVDSAAILQLGNTNATSVTIGRSGITTNIQGNTQVALSGTSGTTLVCQNASNLLSTCTNTYETTTGTDFIQNQTASTQTAGFKINGTGTAATLQVATTGSLDTSAAGALNIGLTSGGNATSINLNQNTQITGDLTFANGATRTISVATQTTPNTAGNNLTVKSAAGAGTGGGGTLALQGGSGGGSSGNGGFVTIIGGSATGGNGSGGNITLTPGVKAGTGGAGLVIVKSSNTSNESTGLFQVQNGSGTAIFAVDTVNSKVGTLDQTVASTNSQSITFQSGNATGATSNSGSITIDAGSATGTAGSISIGTANASGVTIGRAATVTTIQGNTAVTLSATTGTTLVCQNGSNYLSQCDSSYLAPTTTNFIQNQTATTQTGAFKINGTGTAATLQISTTGSFDTSAAGALNIGTTNATSINLNQDVTIAANKSITYSAGTGSFDQSASSGTFKTGTGAVSLNGDTTVATGKNLTVNGGATVLGGSLSTKKGTDFSAVGTQNNINFGATSLVRLTGASAQTLTGIANGTDGYRLTIVNAGTTTATIKNNDTTDSSAANVIITGTGNDISVPAGASAELIYDSGAAVWRVTGSVAVAGGAGVNTIGTFNSGTSYTNGAQISGTTLTLGAADASNPGLVTTVAQTIAGLKTFQGGITSANINTTAGQATILGNSTGTLTINGNASTTFVINGSTVDATEFTRLDGKDAALVDTNDAVATAITGTGALTTGSINWSGAITTSGNIATTGTGTITSAGLLTASGGLTAASINTTAGQTTSLGNSTGAFTVTGNSSSTFVVNGITVDATEFNRLDGKDAALVDTNDAVATAITGTGALTAGSINWSGAITTTGNISTTGTGTITSAGVITANGGLTVANTGSLATQKSADYSTVGSQNDVNLGNGSLVRLTGATSQTLTGIAGGADGRILTIVNAGSATATLSNNNVSSAAANRITTGTGADVALPVGSSITLIYDSGSNLWRVTGSTAASGGAGVNTVGAISGTANANGATITGTTINLTAADGSNGGVLTAGAQTIGGAKTFAALITGNAGLSVSGGTNSLQGNTTIATTAGNSLGLGNSTGTLTITGNSSSTFVINGITVDATEFNRLDGKDAALVDTNDAVATAITGTGTLTTGSINWSGAITTTGNISTTGTGTITSAGLLTASNGLTISSGNFDQSASSGTFKTGTGAISLNGDTTLAGGKNLYTQKGTDFSTTGNSPAANFTGTVIRLTGASTQTIQGVTGAADGRVITLINAAAQAAVIANQNGSAAATERIITGTSQDISLAPDASITLVYDTTTQRWRVQGGVGGTGVTTIGTVSNTPTTNGATITGNTLNLAVADGSNAGLVSTAAQTIAGLKTFQGGITSANINTTAGQATTLGNSTGTLTINGNSSTTFVINGSTVDATEFTRLDGKDAALVDTNDAVATAITGTGALTTGSINWSGAITTSGNISTTGTGTITSAGLLTASGGLTAANINTTAGQTTSFGNSTGAFTVTGNSSSTFVVNGITVDATEFNRLDGKDAALVDTNDAVATAITGTGALTAGSINWSGAISTTGNISTTGTGTITSAGIITANGGVTVANTGSLSTAAGTSFTTAGTTNGAALNVASFYTLNTSGAAQVIQGILAGRDGQRLTLTNTNALAVTLTNNFGTGNKPILTGTGSDMSLAQNASVELIYDATATAWRVVGSVGGTSVTSVGAISGTSNANGATITGNTLNLTAADATNGGVVTNGAQTIAGLKTFQGGITSANINTTAGQATTLGNSTGTLTINGNSSTTFVVNGSTVDATEFTRLDGKDAALVDTNDAVATAITGTGALTAGSINWSGAISTTGNISTTGTGTITSAGLLTASGGLTAANINTTAGQATSFGNSTGAFTVTGNSSSTFVVNGQTVDATEFNRLDGKDAALVDTNDAVATAITGTGALTAGSINWSGAISTTGNISTTGTGTITSAGLITGSNGLAVTGGNTDFTTSIATKAGTDYSTTGVQDAVNFGNVSLVRLTGASAQTIKGIANGRDGYRLTIVNAGTTAATLQNNLSATGGDSIITGTGNDLALPAGASIDLVYDNLASPKVWRVTSAAAGSAVNTIGAYSSSNHYANGAQISGSTLTLGSADASNPGLVDTSAQSFAGLKTFQGGITSANINTTAGQATSLGNATGTLTITGNSSSTFVINGATIDATEFGRLDGKDAALVDTNDAVATAITGTGALTSGSINWSGAITTTGNISTTGTGTITSAGLLTGNAGITTTGGAVSLTGNNNSSLTTTSGTLLLQGAGAVTLSTTNVAAGSSTISIQSGNATAGTAGTVTIDTGTSSTGTSQVNIGTGNAGAVNIGTTSSTTTVKGNLTAGNAAGTGKFTNNGSTLFTADVLGNFGTTGSIGTAAATVDVYTTFKIPQTTGGITLSLPAPTDGAAGHIAYVINTGSAPFTMHTVSVLNGKAQTYVYDGSNWTPTNIDGAGSGATFVDTINSQTKSANGAVITGNGLVLQTADTSFPGLVSIVGQTFAGTKTFQDGVISTNINTAAGTNTTLGNTTGTLSIVSQGGLNVTTGGAVTGVSTLATSGIITVGALGTASNNTVVCYNGSNQLAACTNSFETTTGTDFIQNQSATTQTATFKINGTGTVGTIQIATTGSLDTAAAGAINIGLTTGGNATSINLNQNVNIAAGKNITFGSTGNFDQSASSGTFDTGTGTVTLRGNTSVAAGKNLTFASGAGNFDQSSSTGTFDTGTGNVTLRGNTSVSSGKTFTVAGGATSLTGASGGTALTVTGTGSGAVAAVLQGGNVGIGTASPISALDVRGAANLTGTGTITTSGTAVTGSGTAFGTDVHVGDTITVSGQSKLVSAIASATSLTVASAFSPDISTGTAFTYGQPAARFIASATQTSFFFQGAANSDIADFAGSNGQVLGRILSSGQFNIPAIALTSQFSISAAANATRDVTFFTVNDSNTSATAATINAQNIILSGSNNTNSTNTNNGINFANVTPVTGNNFYGLNFGTGYNDILRYNGNTIITGTGLLTINAIGGASGTTLVCQNGTTLSSCTNSYETTTGTDFIRNQSASTLSGNFNIQGAAGTVAATIKGESGGSSDIVDFVTSGGTTAVKIDSTGKLTAQSASFSLTGSSGGSDIISNTSLSNTSATVTTTSAFKATLTGTNNSNVGANNINAFNFGTITPATNNTFNGLFFGDTNYTNILNVAGTSIIDGTGKLQNAGISSGINYSNLQQVTNLTATGNLTAASINTTAGQATSLGNSTGALTITGNSSSTFVINGTTTTAAQFNLLSGHDVALVDTNDAVATAITGTGALTTGSINWSGNIATSGNISTSGTGTITSAGIITANGGVTVAGTGAISTAAGSSFTTPNASPNAALNAASFYTLNTSGGAQTLQGITAGRDGQRLTLTNINALAVTLANNSGSATGSKIITGTNADISLVQGASVELIYDNTASVWRVVGGAAATGGVGVNAVGAISGTSNANGATITGTTLNLTAADGTNGGVVTNVAQNFAGLKTFNAGLTSASINTTAGINTLIGNATGTFQLQSQGGLNVSTAGALTGVVSVDSSAGLTLGASTATSIGIGKSGITTTVTGNFAQQTGTFSLQGNAASTIATTSGTLGITGAGAVTIGTTSTTVSSGITIKSGDSSAGTAGTIAIDTGTSSTGTSQITIGAANASTVAIGNASGGTTTIGGSLFTVDVPNAKVSVGSALSGSRFSVTNPSGTNTLIAGNQVGTGKLLDLQNNGSSLFNINNTGSITSNITTTDTSAVQFKNNGSAIFNIDTTNGYVISNGTTAPGNILQNSGFESNAAFQASGWNLTSNGTIQIDAGNAHSGSGVMELAGVSSSYSILANEYYAVIPGDTYYVEGWTKASAGATGNGFINVTFYDGSKATPTTNQITANNSTTYTLVSGSYTVPAGKYYMRIGPSVNAAATSGTWYFDDLYAARVNQQQAFVVKNSSSTAFAVQNAGGTNIMNVNAATSTVQFQQAANAATLGAELFTANTFSAATGWGSISGSGATATATHTTGTTAINTNFTPTVGNSYQLTFTINGTWTPNGVDAVCPNMGGTNGVCYNTTGTFSTTISKVTSTAALKFTPTNGFTGTITAVSVKQITNPAASIQILDSTGTASAEIRTGSATSGSTFFGLQGGLSNQSTGTNNTGFGAFALQGNSTGTNNTGVGTNALNGNTTGTNNTALGNGALQYNLTGSSNVAVGNVALTNNFNGNHNIAIGDSALTSSTIGNDNTIIGYNGAHSVTTGSSNEGLGSNALASLTTGSNNVAIGDFAGDTLTTGTGNVVLGSNADIGANNLQNATAIGINSYVTASNSLVLGCVSGTNGCTTTTKVGIGNTAPAALFSVGTSSAFQIDASGNTTTSGTISSTYAGTGSAVNIVTTGNPAAGSALIFANNNSTTPSGNLIELQNKGTDKFVVDASGNVVVNGTEAITAATGTTGLSVKGSTGNDILQLKRPSDGANVIRVDEAGDLIATNNSNLTFTTNNSLNSYVAKFSANNFSGAGTVTQYGVEIALDQSNTSGTNVQNGINFDNVASYTNSTYNGLNFGTGYNNLLTSANATLSAAGTLSLSNATAANTISITSTANPTTALAVINNNSTTPSGNLLALQNKGTNKFTVDVNGNVVAAGTLQVGGGATADIDTSSATTLKIGTTNATTITLGKATQTVVLAGNVQLQNTITNNDKLDISGQITSNSANQYSFTNQVDFNPTVASPNIWALNNTANLVTSAQNVANLIGIQSGVSSSAGYTGTVTTATGINVGSPSISGTNKFTNYNGIVVNGNSVNGGNTSGILTNTQLQIQGITAGAGASGTVNNYGINITQPSGSGGTTNNYGLYIQGAGAGSSNYSIYNSSTANSYFAGNVGIGDTSPSTLFSVGSGHKFTVDASGNVVVTNVIDTASTLSLGTGTATAVSIGKSATTTTINGALSVGGSTIQFLQGGTRTINIAQAASGAGNQLTIAAGQGATNNNGGTLSLSGGAGAGTGVQGLVSLAPTAFGATTQTIASSGNLNNVDSFSTFAVTATNPSLTLTVPAPTIQTIGRIIYVSNAGTTNDFNLLLSGTSITIGLKANSTATLIWNGNGWTAAGASSSTDLQAAYNNTLSSAGAAELVLSYGTNHDGLTIRDNSVGASSISTNTTNGTLLEVQTGQAANVFSVNSKVTDYATDGGSETGGGDSSTSDNTFPASSWSKVGSVGVAVSRYTTAGGNIATGIASAGVTTTAVANDGIKDTLNSTLTANTHYNVSFSARLGSGSFTNMSVYYSVDGTTQSVACTTGQAIKTSVWTKVNCSFAAPASGETSTNAILIQQASGVIHTFYIDNLSVTIAADYNYATDGGVDDSVNFSTNWPALGATVTRETADGNDASDSAKVVTTAANQGVKNKLSINPLQSTLYRVSVYAKLSSGTFNNFTVAYSPTDGGVAGAQACTDYNTQTLTTTGWTQITCYLNTGATGVTTPRVYFYQTDGTGRTFWVDTFSMTLASSATPNVQIGGGLYGGPTTLLTLDRAASAPIAANNDALLGSMYYDTTLGKLQCYEADGWGACGSSPDNIVTISPEYTNAVFHGSGVGVMTSDICSDALHINDGTSSQPTICGTNETYNFYKWTSPQPTTQTYSIYVTYQLPTTFKAFASGETYVMGRTDNGPSGGSATVQYSVYRNNSGTGLSQCGSTVAVSTGTSSSWSTATASGAADPSTCGFGAGDSIVLKIDVIANKDANAYVGNLGFTFSNK